MDHRGPLETLAAELDAGESALEAFKALGLEAVDRVARGDPRYGILLDGRFGRQELERAADRPYWIGRPIEQSGSRPLELDGVPDVGSTLRTWPLNHVVKCLVRYHPDDPEPLHRQQEERLLCLPSGAAAARDASISSRVRPLVSGTKAWTKSQERTPSPTNTKNVEAMPSPAAMLGKPAATTKLASQSIELATPNAKPRIASGKSSERRTHIVGHTNPC